MKRVSGFHRIKEIPQRRSTVFRLADLGKREAGLFDKHFTPSSVFDSKYGYLNKNSENVISELALPLSVVLNALFVDEKGVAHDMIVPMSSTEATVVAAVNRVFKLIYNSGGMRIKGAPSIAKGEATYDVENEEDNSELRSQIMSEMTEIKSLMASFFASMTERGGGVKDIILEECEDGLSIVITADVCDAIGAMKMEQAATIIANHIKYRFGREHLYAICSNSNPERIAEAECSIPFSLLEYKGYTGERVAQMLIKEQKISQKSRVRRATHDKGFRNGFDAVLLALGQDLPANSMSFQDYFMYEGKNNLLTTFGIKFDPDLGQDVLTAHAKCPCVVGTRGCPRDSIQVDYILEHIMGNPSAPFLSGIAVGVGLASVIAAVTSLTTKDFHKSFDMLTYRRV